jgi:hypothetical protein
MTVAANVTIRGARASLVVSNAVLSVGGSLALTNSAKLYAYGGVANVTSEYGALVVVGQNLSIGAGCTNFAYSQATNGGSCKWSVGSLQLDGVFSADSLGCAGGTSTHTAGYGFSNARPGGVGPYGAGAGYGGIGGDALGSTTSHGATYGSPTHPLWPGSGGARGSAANGSPGGGLVWVEATGNVVLNGRITANGAYAAAHGGAGSGGGVYLNCDQLTGSSNGRLFATGGSCQTGSGGGGGGGGRIAVRCKWLRWAYTNQVAVTGGAGGYPDANYQGQLGTVFWDIRTPKGVMFMVR